jgi:1A family penicillin-binding protein
MRGMLHPLFGRRSHRQSRIHGIEKIYFRMKERISRIPKPILYTRLAFAALIFIITSLIGVTIFLLVVANDLPRPGKVQRETGFSTVILDRNGERLYDLYSEENRIPLKSISDAPKNLRDATIAIEDKQFYTHQGLSFTGILRGMSYCVLLRRCQGGSTLTQQLVKNVLLSQERTVMRKIKEAILALQIERKYTKDEILQMYLSEAPYGGPTVGVVAASEYYFNKSVSNLTLSESAFLAGLPQDPTNYSPYISDKKAYINRTEQVLTRMVDDKYITVVEKTNALKEVNAFTFEQGTSSSLRAPHFIAYIKNLLEKEYGSDKIAQGLTVTTTLDYPLQEKAQSIVKDEVAKVKYLKVGNGSAVVLDPSTGEILAMVGSKDYGATDSAGFQFNVAVQGLRQPGSSIKPITYASALMKGYTPSTLLLDVETKYPSGDPKKEEYNPKNYDLKYRGPIQLRFALANSINTIAVKLSALTGVKDTLRLAYDMGISTLEPTNDNLNRIGLSMTLGGGEVTLLDLTSAYGVFANKGEQIPPVAIKKIEDSKGKVIFEYKTPSPKRVIKEDISYLISNILSDNDARKEVFGTNSQLVIPGKTTAVKTGTTDDKRDNWTIGYTPNRVVGVWVGNNDNTPMNPLLASGLTGAAPIWNKIMKESLSNIPDTPFVRPDTITEVEIDAYGGGLPVPDRPTRRELFIKGTEPTSISKIYQKLKVSKRDSSKLANTIEIAKGEYDEKSFVVFKEDDPVSTDGKNRWQDGIDSWISTQSDDRLKVPKDTYSGSDEKLVIRFKKPTNEQRIDNNTVEVKIEAKGLEDIKTIEFYVDGEKKSEVNSASYETTINLINGSHELKAKVKDNKDNTAEDSVRIGVNTDYQQTPIPTPTNTPVAIPTSSH